MPKIDKKLTDFGIKLRSVAYKPRNTLYDMTFNYGIHENQTIEIMAKVAEFGSYAMCALGIISILIGLLAIAYGQIYLSKFAFICVLHLMVGPLAYLAFKDGKRIMFMGLICVNHLWIGFTLLYVSDYIFFEEDQSFSSNIMHHCILCIYLLLSMAVQVLYVWIAITLIKLFNQKITDLKEPKT